jgi:hypothetical protein
MKKTSGITAAMILGALLALWLALPSASAAGSAEVYVNGQLLNASNPYWKNGNATASPTDWNAHFDAAAATLTLNNAVINTEAAVSYHLGSWGLVVGDGDLSLVLVGNNSLTYDSDVHADSLTVISHGDLTIGGSGSMSIRNYNAYSHSRAFGISSDEGLTILGGSLTLDIRGEYGACGLYGRSVLFAGGQADIQTQSDLSIAVYAVDGDFRMTGGTVRAEAGTTGDFASALQAHDIDLKGGSGVFTATGQGTVYGVFFENDVFEFSGGCFIFSGETSALRYNDEIMGVTYTLTGGPVYVSETADGSGKRLWTSAADGRLESDLYSTSPFRYVQFGNCIPAGEMPRTGDTAVPLLWEGTALCALLIAAGWTVIARRKRR